MLQEAYSRLKAELKGYTFTEEDLYKMYERDKAADEKVYENDEHAREQFEQWKRQQFSAYDQQMHDDFLHKRYQRTFYKYAENKRHTPKQNEDFRDSFSA